MIIIPAIDLHAGKVVRLKKGRFDEVTTYSHDPAEVARSFQEAGARRIHVVDLDGSLQGRGINMQAIAAVCEAVDVEVELGGGIRSGDAAERAFDLGVAYVILGTMVVKDPAGSHVILRRFPGRVALGIDADQGRVAVQGWTEVTGRTALELAREYEEDTPAFIVYTDIARDGMLTGPNIKATAELARAVTTPVVASGGVSSVADLAALAGIPEIFGAITGKALYEGRIDLKHAIETVQNSIRGG